MHEPVFIGNEKKYLDECIESTYVSSVGKFVDLFEAKTAEYTGAKKAVVCVNGTNALHLALMLVGVEKGTEVITQPLTFIATANAITYTGAVPVFLDVDKNNMGLSPDAIEQWLMTSAVKKKNKRTNQFETYNKTTGRRIAACVPMHTFGHPCKIDRIVEICNENNIPVVEDAAESLGSTYKGKHTGCFGKIGVFSFNGNKIVTTGGGGMLLFQDELLAARAKHLTTQAKVPHPWEFYHDEVGYNYRMPNLNAALGLAQLENLELFVSKKRKLAMAYKDFFKASDIEFFIEPFNSVSNYWLNVITFKTLSERDNFLAITNEQGIKTRPTWHLNNELPMFRHCESGDLSNAEWFAKHAANLPSSVILTL